MATLLETTIRPYSCKDHELQVGRMVDGQFVVERGLWNVLKDTRLSVKRSYEGRGTQTDVTFKVIIPENYPLVIALKEKYNHQLTRPDYRYEVLYAPVEKKEVVKKPRVKKEKKVSPVVAALQIPEGKKARLVKGKIVIK